MPNESEKYEKNGESLIRASTKEIDETIHQLQLAYQDGRLDEQEFDERMAKAIKVKTKGEITDLLRDLKKPDQSLTKREISATRKLGDSATAVFSGIEQKGNFILPKSYRITAILGGCLIDLTDARFESSVTDIHVTAILGGVQILVPQGIRVEVHGFPLLGGFSQKVTSKNLPPDAPVIYIRGSAILGGVEVKTARS